MSEALEQAYASATETPLETYEFSHSALTDGVLRFVRGRYDLSATLEDSSVVTFTAAAMETRLPQKTTEGRQDIEITLSNVDNTAWQELDAVITANRSSDEKIALKYRPYLESDTSAPAGNVYTLTIMSASCNRNSISMRASYTPLPDVVFPRLRYYPTVYPGLKYV